MLLELLYSFIVTQNTGKMAVNNVTRDFRVRLPKSQIVKLTKNTVQEYVKICNVEKPSSDLQAYVMHCHSDTGTITTLQAYVMHCHSHTGTITTLLYSKQ